MIEYLVLIIILFYFTISSIEDIKKREVYDYINFSLSFIILTIAIFHSLLINSIIPIKYVGFGFLIGFAFGSILYYLGIWGGGDAKFLIGFSAGSFYLINILHSKIGLNLIYNKFINSLSLFFSLFLNSFLNIILVINIIFLILIFINIILNILANIKLNNNENLKNKRINLKKINLNEINKIELKNSLNLFLILFLMSIGLYFKYSNFIIIIIGFIVFNLIFFADESLFISIYLKIKKNIKDLKENDKITNNIRNYKNNKILINYEKSKFGLTKEDILILKENSNLNFEINIKKVFPISTIIILNYILYLFKIINLDKINLEILGFLLKFLFYSFIVGGIIAICLIIYYYIKNLKKINLKLTDLELKLIIFSSIFFIIISFYKFQLILLLITIPIYLFLKISKEVEKFMFIKKKEISKIVLGDWICQEIKNNSNKLIYSSNEFKLGVNEFQLEKIKELAKTNNKLKKIYVKDGLAFIPPLFIGFLIILLI